MRPGLAVKQRAFGATASLHGLMECRGHHWPSGKPTNERLQHALVRLCCFVEQFTLVLAYPSKIRKNQKSMLDAAEFWSS